MSEHAMQPVARLIGYRVQGGPTDTTLTVVHPFHKPGWNPEIFDGDALDLAAKLGCQFAVSSGVVSLNGIELASMHVFRHSIVRHALHTARMLEV